MVSLVFNRMQTQLPILVEVQAYLLHLKYMHKFQHTQMQLVTYINYQIVLILDLLALTDKPHTFGNIHRRNQVQMTLVF